MKKRLSCACNLNSGCVELKFVDDSMIAIDCTTVENEAADHMDERPGPNHQIDHESLWTP